MCLIFMIDEYYPLIQERTSKLTAYNALDLSMAFVSPLAFLMSMVEWKTVVFPVR